MTIYPQEEVLLRVDDGAPQSLQDLPLSSRQVSLQEVVGDVGSGKLDCPCAIMAIQNHVELNATATYPVLKVTSVVSATEFSLLKPRSVKATVAR